MSILFHLFMIFEKKYPLKLYKISSDEMDKFIEIGKKLGVKNVQWSGLTRKQDLDKD